MCDYSLEAVNSRAAKAGDDLVVHTWQTGTRGFADPADLETAVCLLPGTELSFDAPVSTYTIDADPPFSTAQFIKVDEEDTRRHHDALKFPDGSTVMLTTLCYGQTAHVLQLPVVATAHTDERSAVPADVPVHVWEDYPEHVEAIVFW